MKKLIVLLALPLLVASLIIVNGSPHLVEASFNKNILMDDYVMQNSGTMSAGQINAFLSSFPNSCISQNRGFSAPEPTGYSPSGGYTYGANVSAGQVLYATAQAYHINPQVLLVTLQKEQSLVVGEAGCTVKRYTAATGYGCPDSGNSYNYSGLNLYSINGNTVSSVDGTCVNSSTKAGFSQQVIRAAWLLRFGQERSRGNTGWAEIHGSWNNSDDLSSCYGGPMTQGDRKRCPNGATSYFDGYTTIDGEAIHMDTGATAALYWYTPHLHGNQNFVAIFEAWFGPTQGQGFVKAISDDPNDLRQWVIYANIKQYIPDGQTVNAWGLGDVPLTTMPASRLAAISTGPNLGRLMVLNDGSQTIYFVDGGKRYKIPWMTLFQVWNFPGQVVSGVSPALFLLPSDGGDMSFSVKDPNSTTVYMLDGGNSNGQTVLRPYQNSALMAAWEGSSANYMTVSTDYFATIDDAIGLTLSNTKVRYGTSLFQIVGGKRLPVNSPIQSLYPGSDQFISGATLARLPISSQWVTQLVKGSGPSVYLVDGGQKYQILWPDSLNAWSVPGQTIVTVNDSFLDLLTTGSSIGGYLADVGGQLYIIDHVKTAVPAALDTAYRNSGTVFNASASLMSLYPTSGGTPTGVIKASKSPAVYMLDNSGKRRHLEWSDKVSAWGGYRLGVTALSDYIVNSMGTDIPPSTFVSDGTTNYLLDDGLRWSVSASAKTAWGLGTPQTYTDGTLSRLTTVGALDMKVSDGKGGYFLVRNGTAYGTADSNIAQEWDIENAPVMSPRAIPANLPVFMLTRFVKSNMGGDNRTFVIDDGNWYNAPAAQLANLGGVGVPTMSLDPALAPNTITDWQSVVVKSLIGTHYVIDGGGKRFFNHPTIQNQWTNNGAITIPTVTDGFLNLLPTRGFIERTIKASAPEVFFYESGAKRHIRFPNTYNLYYAPYMLVSDQLMNVLPTGAPI